MTGADDREMTRPDDGTPVDLAPLRAHSLDAACAPARWEQLVRRIDAAAAPELARRRNDALAAARTPGVVGVIARYATPMVAAAAAIAIAATALAVTAPSNASAGTLITDEVSVARALQVREPAATWLASDQGPSSGDIVSAVTGDGTP